MKQKPKDTYWTTRHVRTPKSQDGLIGALMRREGCKTFSDYVRHLIRVQPKPLI